MADPIPASPRWSRSYSSARNFIKEKGINWLPVDLFKIYESEKWLITTAEYGQELFPDYDWGKFYRDEIDAVTYKKRGHYITLYNERFPTERIRWTLAHEIGHITLGHLDDFEETKVFRSGLTDEKYGVLEQEAHSFAAELLTPSVPLLVCDLTKSEKIRQICCVSKEAAGKRESTLKKRKSQGIKVSEVKFYRTQFHNFIHQRICRTCNHYFINSEAKYCPICGGQSTIWGMSKNMIYDGVDVNENGKAIICPICKNEQIHPLYHRCKICGIYLVNQCVGEKEYDNNGSWYYTKQPCQMTTEGNARFCVNCGCETTFFEQGVLKSWDSDEKANNS